MPLYEGNTVEEAVTKGLKALDLSKEDATIQVVSKGKKGFLGIGKKLAQVSIEPAVSEQISEAVEETVEAVLAVEMVETPESNEQKVKEELEDEEAITELALYLTNISKELNAPAFVQVKREGEEIVFCLDSKKQGMLIGKHGKILNALQYLAQVFIHRVAKNKLSVVVNVGDYREKRQAILQRLATRTAEKVKATGRPVFLEPMPAFERKQIHAVLSQDEQIKTYSEGNDPHRYLVVELTKKY